MTAVRRLLTITCLTLIASALPAQTTKKQATTAKPAPAPLVASPDPDSAQGQSTTTRTVTSPVTADTDKDVDDPRALHLSLDESVRQTVERNLGVQFQRYDYQMAGQSLVETWGVFDPEATAAFARSKTQSPTVSQFASSSSTANTANFGLNGNLPTGANYGISFNNSKVNQVGGGTFVNPSYNSSLGLAATQPLLRNFGIDIGRRNIFIARNTLGISSEAFRSVLINTAQLVEQAYLDLVYARQNVDVQKEALFLARDQARITQIRIDVGASAPLDILQPRVQIATTEEQLITAVAAVRDAEDRLRQLMHLDPGDWDRPIIPTDPMVYTPMTLDPETAVTRAMELRPEIREQKLGTDSKRIEYLFARNQVLPRVDLALNYRAAGLGGTFFDTDPVTGQLIQVSKNSYPHALSQVAGNDFPSWSVGVNVGIPLFNIAARAEAKRAELDLDQSKTLEAQTRENVVVDVRKTVRDIDTAAKQIAASRAAREAAEQNLDAERKRYENGMTTNFNVLQIQQQLSDARVREIQALVSYDKAVASYHRAVGDLLDVRNIKVEMPEAPREPALFSWFDRYTWLNYGHYSDNNEQKK